MGDGAGKQSEVGCALTWFCFPYLLLSVVRDCARNSLSRFTRRRASNDKVFVFLRQLREASRGAAGGGAQHNSM
jgi:hypothetical protein